MELIRVRQAGRFPFFDGGFRKTKWAAEAGRRTIEGRKDDRGLAAAIRKDVRQRKEPRGGGAQVYTRKERRPRVGGASTSAAYGGPTGAAISILRLRYANKERPHPWGGVMRRLWGRGRLAVRIVPTSARRHPLPRIVPLQPRFALGSPKTTPGSTRRGSDFRLDRAFRAQRLDSRLGLYLRISHDRHASQHRHGVSRRLRHRDRSSHHRLCARDSAQADGAAPPADVARLRASMPPPVYCC